MPTSNSTTTIPLEDYSEMDINDANVLGTLTPEVQKWWESTFGEYVPQNKGFFTPPQKQAIPQIKSGKNTLIASPTGSGKTLASFTTVLDALAEKAVENTLENSVYCLYISPLKSLANDIHRNLEEPLKNIQTRLDTEAEGDVQQIRQAIRHGDTPDSKRQKMLQETPHILNTTPETLAILLNSRKFKEKLETVEYVIVDEIHSLADNKRGTHLSVSLERLEEMVNSSPTRIGCSATVEPLDTIAEFLVGYENGSAREYEVVDTRFVRDYDLEVESPVPDLINTSKEVISEKFYERLHTLIQESTNTLIFTNTRSGAERILQNLRNNFTEYTESNSGCHHGSLSKENRREVEEKLKDGDLDVVTSSTSLELGVDMPYLDLVIQVGSPKSIASLLQRIGRAGHQLGQTVTGRVLVLDRDELVECAVMAKKAEEGFIDRVFIPEGAQDVATQHVYGMAINKIRPKDEVLQVLQRAYPYREYTEQNFEQLIKYMTGGYDGLQDKNVYPKIWCDTNDPPEGDHHYDEYEVGEQLIGKRGRLASVIYMTNLGTIPDSFTCDVYTRNNKSWEGSLDERYLDTLDKGDVFVLGGDRYEYQYRRGSKVYVDTTTQRPTVPSWFSERLPLSYDLGTEILTFQNEITTRLQNNDPSDVITWISSFPINTNAAHALVRMYEYQRKYLSSESISTQSQLVIEEEEDNDEFMRRYYIHSVYGRKFNDGLSRLLAYKISQEENATVKVAVSDQGFTLSIPLNRSPDVAQVLENISTSEVESTLRESLNGTDLLKRYFRINATRSLLILKNYKGHTKSAKSQQVSSEMLLGFVEDLDNFAVLEETYRELLEDKLDIRGLTEVLSKIETEEINVSTTSVPSPSPRAFSLAALSASDVVIAEDESQVLQDFYTKVTEEVGEVEIDMPNDQ